MPARFLPPAPRRGRRVVELSALQRERVRRSQRVSVALPVLVTSLDPEIPYSEHCMTFVVNRHGCGLRAPRPIGPKTRVRLEVGTGKHSATAHVVMCTAIRGKKDLWELGIELDVPKNLWGFHFPPPDWIVPMEVGAQEETQDESPPAQPVVAPELPKGPSLHVQTSSVASEPLPGAHAAPIPLEPASPPTATLPPPTVGTPVATMRTSAAAETKEEVSFSLAEMQDEVTPSLPPSEAPTAATGEAAPQPVARDRQETTQEFEQGLREAARRISAEFEEGYRRSLGELLARLRADLEGQATDDWNRLLRQAEERERDRQQESQALVDARLKELLTLRDYVESLLRAAPQTLQHHLQEGTASALAEMRGRLEQDLNALAQTESQRLQQHVEAVLAQAAQDARQTLLDDFDRQEREFLDRIGVRLEEVRASADHTREFAKRASADIARQSEQLRVDLQSQFDSLFEQQRQELARRLEDRHQQLSQAAHAALQNLGGRLWGSLRQHLNADFEGRARELQQSLQTAQAETRALREHTETLRAQQEALVAEFKRDSEAIAADCLAQFQAAVRETLESIEQVLRSKLRLPRETP